jgi:hypothetical protein
MSDGTGAGVGLGVATGMGDGEEARDGVGSGVATGVPWPVVVGTVEDWTGADGATGVTEWPGVTPALMLGAFAGLAVADGPAVPPTGGVDVVDPHAAPTRPISAARATTLRRDRRREMPVVRR